MRKNRKDDLERYKDITVADMNVEGMPWYGKKPEEERGTSSGDASGQKEPIGLRETFKLIGSSLIMVLLIGGVFFLFFFLLLLFMTRVWL